MFYIFFPFSSDHIANNDTKNSTATLATASSSTTTATANPKVTALESRDCVICSGDDEEVQGKY